MTPFDPTKPCCLRADLDKPADQRRKVRILATDLPGEWPICAWTEGLLFAQLYTTNGSVASEGNPCGDDLVNIPPAPAPRCEPPPEYRDKDGWHWMETHTPDRTRVPSLWNGREWYFRGGYTSASTQAKQYRYHSPCVPGLRYGEADPRDAEIERRKVQVSELLKINKEVGCAATNLQTNLAAKDAEIQRLRDLIREYEVWGRDVKRLTRDIDVALHGEAGAATQASLCDLVAQAKHLRNELSAARQPIEMTGKMVDAAWAAWNDSLGLGTRAMRRAIEAALAAREG